MQLTVAVITTAKGLKGEVKLDVRTDAPETRLVEGAMFETDPAPFGPVTLATVREYKDAYYVKFAEYNDRTQAESLRGVKLVIESDEDTLAEDEWFRHDLEGLEALDPEGYELGTVIDVEFMPGHDNLVIREPDGVITRVPFVKEIVTEVDLDDNCVVIDAPPGLFSEEDLIIDEPSSGDQA